ncbi:MAG: DUF547 domain-containing protein [Chloroflexi bacterium]|nr:DUF547 domain-containing protein [Chloroflexota bacterium]
MNHTLIPSLFAQLAEKLSDIFITLRQASINKLLNISSNTVLNAQVDKIGPVDSQKVITKIKQAVNEFKELAIDSDGNRVDYTLLRESEQYHNYCEELVPQLRGIDLDSLGTGARATAFWINLYNALTINGVISSNIQNSVAEGWLGIVRFFQRTAYNVGGLRFSLEDIEHGILRANRGNIFLPGAHFSSHDPRQARVIPKIDARIHFALNCASQSCPPIRVYSADHLDEQLDLAARNFINHEVTFNQNRDKLVLSLIFKWYQADFGGKANLFRLLNQYLPEGERHLWLSHFGSNAEIKYRPYNWELNI